MSDRRASTVKIKTKQGTVDYAKVAARLSELHGEVGKCSIETTVTFHSGNHTWVVCSAKLTTGRGVFTGHSMGKVTDEKKVLEKLETISVGRALAFAGYLASGEIASFEEMVESDVQKDAFYHAFTKDLQQASSSEEIETLREKLNTMVQDQIIDAGQGLMIIEEIFARKRELESTDEAAEH